MAVPQLSPEERQAALEKAKIARAKRAEVREKLKQGDSRSSRFLTCATIRSSVAGRFLLLFGNPAWLW